VKLLRFQAGEGVAKDDLLFSSLGKKVAIASQPIPA
jgi:hypothetical protein